MVVHDIGTRVKTTSGIVGMGKTRLNTTWLVPGALHWASRLPIQRGASADAFLHRARGQALASEIRVLHRGVRKQFRCRTGERNPSVFDHIAPIGDTERRPRVLFDQQDSAAAVAQFDDDWTICSMMRGANPSDGSSRRRRCGRAIKAGNATFCCSSPLSESTLFKPRKQHILCLQSDAPGRRPAARDSIRPKQQILFDIYGAEEL
jgi:hypothetical protein